MKALDLAKYILTTCKGISISNLHLQKILYFINAYYVGKTGRFLVQNDFQAWQHGPVVPEVYSKFSYLGSQSIPLSDSEKVHTIYNKKDEDGHAIGEDIDNELRSKILILANKDPWELVRHSHSSSGAWYKTFYNKGQWSPIDKKLIVKEAAQYAN